MKLFGNKKYDRRAETTVEYGTKKRRKNRVFRLTTVIMSVAVLASLLLIPAWAYSPNTQKQEVVYINLKNNGGVDGIYVVNSFDLNKDGQIIDYGDYSSLRNLTSDDEVKFDNQAVTINTTAGKLYYEGTLNSSVIPWVFDIHYYLDGKEYTADEIAGKSGSLKISMSVRKNAECNSAFFEHYALQTSFTFDTFTCRNIIADGATQANKGSDKQLTYTILPNSEKDIEITADVTDFKMDGIAINGVSMNMGVDINLDDNQEVQDQITQLQDGTAKLNDGAGSVESGADSVMNAAGQIKNGSSELQGYTLDLKNGAVKMQTGVSDLNNGLGMLSSNSGKINDGAYQVFQSMTQAAQKQINAVLTASKMEPITLTPESYSAVLTGLLNTLSKTESYQSLVSVKNQLDSYNAFYQGLLSYTAGVDQAAQGAYALAGGASSLVDGATKLSNASVTLCNGAVELYNGTVELHDGTVTLKDGTLEFKDKTADMTATLKDKIKSTIQNVFGGDFKPVSFASDKNTNVDSVQFVIKTPSIAVQEQAAATTQETASMNLWDKILNLFGLYK